MGRPLEDVIVLDLSQYAAGPYGVQILADAGARVVKVETPGTGDPYRHEGPRLPGGGPDDGTYFLRFNRNKESVAIDLRHPDGRRAFDRLVARADVLVENLKPGSLARLGYPYERLQALNRRLVYATVTGFGHPDLLESPLWRWPAFAVVAEAMGGLMAVIGDADCRPHGSAVSAGDLVAGIHAALGVMFALHQRERTGEGQRVDVAMADSIAALSEQPVFTYGATGRAPTRGPSRNMAPFGAFPAADGHVAIGVIGPAVWRRLCEAIERPDLRDDPELASGQGRAAHLADRIAPALEGWLRDRPKAEAARYLAERQVPAAPVLDAREVAEDPHFRARQMVLALDYPGAGTFLAAGNPIKLGSDPAPPVRRPPRLGEHTDAVLAELAGLAPEEIAELRARGAVS
ncbi:MAG TPA: CoA transferase [Candidatus Dormibacteraeota bacterium]|nr:CoA transferase [Candidatus Dormibacteraeota bacterium]